MLAWAIHAHNGPVAIRYPRGGDGAYQDDRFLSSSTVVTHRCGQDCAIVTYGTLIPNCMVAADLLKQEGIEASVIRLTQLNPLPVEHLMPLRNQYKHIFVVEEVCSGSGIANEISHVIGKECVSIDLGKAFVTHGAIGDLYKRYGLDSMSIARKIQEVMRHEN